MCMHTNIPGNDCWQCLGGKVAATVTFSGIMGAQGALVRKVGEVPYYTSAPQLLMNAKTLRSAPKPLLAASLITVSMVSLVGSQIGTFGSLKNKASQYFPGWFGSKKD